MPLFRAAALAAFGLALAGAGGSATEPPAGPATAQVGPETGDPEKDSVGLVHVEEDGCGLVPLFARNAVSHGPRTGDPEKDNVGLRLAGQYDSCDGTTR